MVAWKQTIVIYIVTDSAILIEPVHRRIKYVQHYQLVIKFVLQQ